MKLSKSRLSYVYTYSIDNKHVYVGIGTEDDGAFIRAKDFKGHPELKTEEYHKIVVDIVARKLSRKNALAQEMVLIQTLGAHNELRNKRVTHRDVKRETVVGSKLTVSERVADKLKNDKQGAIDLCLRYFKACGPSLFHNFYLKTKVSEKTSLLQKAVIGNGYDPSVDSLMEQLHEWWREVAFNPVFDKAVILVHKKQHADAMMSALAEGGLKLGRIIVISLEEFFTEYFRDPKMPISVSKAVQGPELALPDQYQGPLADAPLDYLETYRASLQKAVDAGHELDRREQSNLAKIRARIETLLASKY